MLQICIMYTQVYPKENKTVFLSLILCVHCYPEHHPTSQNMFGATQNITMNKIIQYI